jgi:4'-phosphopantetheinyl transferase
VLTADEIARAEHFSFEKDRNRFVVARGLLRVLLAAYLRVEPQQLRFCYNAYGKPALDDALQECALQFNLSHSQGLALFAFAYQRVVGIDVEYMRAGIEYEQLAQHFFSPYEHEVLQALPNEMRREAFFNCWTRKEAYIKARGEGLSIPLDAFAVSLRPGESAALLNNREDLREVTRWSLCALAPGTEYAGALAVEGSGWRLSCWHWQERPGGNSSFCKSYPPW